MKVLITGCSNEDYWYDKEIGNIHEVFPEKNDNGDFEMVNDREFAIDPQDCHVIQSVGTVLTEWEKSGGELEVWSFYLKEWVEFIKEDGVKLDDILRIKPVETPQYRRYTFEEAKEAFTKQAWLFDKQTEELVSVFRIREDGVFLASYPKTEYDLLLSNFNHLDGTPCGVKIN